MGVLILSYDDPEGGTGFAGSSLVALPPGITHVQFATGDGPEVPCATVSDATFELNAQSSITIDPSGYLSNSGNDQILYPILSIPLWGEFSSSDSGSLTYRSTYSYGYQTDVIFAGLQNLSRPGLCPLTYALWTINIIGDIDHNPPLCENVSLTTIEGSTIEIPTNCKDADGDPLTYWASAIPDSKGLTPQGEITGGSTLSYTPTGFTGTAKFLYWSNDGLYDSTLSELNIEVLPRPTCTLTASKPNFNIGESAAYSFTKTSGATATLSINGEQLSEFPSTLPTSQTGSFNAVATVTGDGVTSFGSSTCSATYTVSPTCLLSLDTAMPTSGYAIDQLVNASFTMNPAGSQTAMTKSLNGGTPESVSAISPFVIDTSVAGSYLYSLEVISNGQIGKCTLSYKVAAATCSFPPTSTKYKQPATVIITQTTNASGDFAVNNYSSDVTVKNSAGQVISARTLTANSDGTYTFNNLVTPRSGTHTISVTVLRKGLAITSCKNSLSISNNAPISSNLSVTVPKNATSTIQLPAWSDKESNPSTYIISVLPKYADPNKPLQLNASTGEVEFTPAPGFTGKTEFKFKVADEDKTSGDYTVAITVK